MKYIECDTCKNSVEEKDITECDDCGRDCCPECIRWKNIFPLCVDCYREREVKEQAKEMKELTW